MGTLANGFVYTNTASAKTVDLVSQSYAGTFRLTYTEYYNINTNQSCLAITPSFMGRKPNTHEVTSIGVYNNNVAQAPFKINGAWATDAQGNNINCLDNRYLRLPSFNNSSFIALNVVNSGPALPWYSQVITHNTDGSKSVNVWVDARLKVTERYETSEGGGYNSRTLGFNFATETVSIALTTIPRASTLVMPDTTVGTAVTGTLTKASANFTHTITATYSDGFTQNISSDLAFSPNSTHAYASMGASDKYATITFTVQTFNGSTQIGSSTTTSKVYSAGVAPTTTLTGTINNPQTALTGTEKIIYNFTNLTLSVSGTGANGANIAAYGIGTSTTSYTSAQTLTFTVGENHTFYGKATDTRGVSGTDSLTYSYVQYIKPTISCSATLPDTSTGAVTATVRGNFFNGSFGSASNSITVQVRYQEVGSSSYSAWQTATTTTSGNTYTSTATFIVDYQKAYYVFARITDSLQEVSTPNGYYINNKPIIYWTKNQVVVNNDLEQNAPAHFNAAVTVDGAKLILQKSSNPWISLRDGNGDEKACVYYSTGDSKVRLGVQANASYKEYYGTPAIDSSITADKYYDILTSKAGQTLNINGIMKLGSNSYGTTLPSSGVAGQLFFLKV